MKHPFFYVGYLWGWLVWNGFREGMYAAHADMWISKKGQMLSGPSGRPSQPSLTQDSRTHL